jgi:hypothetical protein
MNNNTISISYEFLSHLGEADCNSRVHNTTITVSFTEMGKELIVQI